MDLLHPTKKKYSQKNLESFLVRLSIQSSLFPSWQQHILLVRLHLGKTNVYSSECLARERISKKKNYAPNTMNLCVCLCICTAYTRTKQIRIVNNAQSRAERNFTFEFQFFFFLFRSFSSSFFSRFYSTETLRYHFVYRKSSKKKACSSCDSKKFSSMQT